MGRWVRAAAVLACFVHPAEAALPLSEVVDRMDQRQQSIQDITFGFIEHTGAAGTDSSQALTGTVQVKQSPRWIRVVQKTPQESTLITNGVRVWIYTPSAKQQLTGDFHRWGSFTHFPQEILDLAGNFRKEEWQKDYNVYYGGYEHHQYELRFKPIDAQARPDVIQMTLWLAEDSFLPARWELVMKEGRIQVDLNHVTVNQGLDVSVFDPRVPAGTAEVPVVF